MAGVMARSPDDAAAQTVRGCSDDAQALRPADGANPGNP